MRNSPNEKPSTKRKTLDQQIEGFRIPFYIASLAGTLAEEDCGDGLEEDLDVFQERPLRDIRELEFTELLEIETRTAADLPETRNAGLHGETAGVGLFEEQAFIFRQGTGTDQAHLAFDDVEQLGQLIQAVFAQELTNRGDAGVVLDFEEFALQVGLLTQLLAQAVCVGLHRAELIHEEGFVAFSNAFAGVQHRPF